MSSVTHTAKFNMYMLNKYLLTKWLLLLYCIKIVSLSVCLTTVVLYDKNYIYLIYCCFPVPTTVSVKGLAFHKSILNKLKKKWTKEQNNGKGLHNYGESIELTRYLTTE